MDAQQTERQIVALERLAKHTEGLVMSLMFLANIYHPGISIPLKAFLAEMNL